jgi:hypothetical protein
MVMHGQGIMHGYQPSKPTKMEVSGESDYLQGQKLPGVFKQQAKHLNKVKEDKNKLKVHLQNMQKKQEI